MATEENKEVKEFVETVSIEGKTGGDSNDEDTEDTETESSQSETEGDEDTEKTEEESDDTSEETDEETAVTEPDKVIEKKPAATGNPSVRLPGETDKEYALRLETQRLRGLLSQQRKDEISIKGPDSRPAKKELSDDKKKVLERYKPEDIQNLREVFNVMAEDMGFVRADELGAKSYAEKAGEELDSFIGSHPEYLPENDPDNIMWGKFKEEYNQYKQPENPKDFKKIFEKVHREIFGVKPTGTGITKIAAQKEKVKVASHSGASKPATTRKNTVTRSTSGLRLDMLKGFSDEEKADMESGGEE